MKNAPQSSEQESKAVVFQDNRYQYVSELGTGGMSRVIRARDKTLKRDVAIKVLLTNAQYSPEALLRFQREAKTAGLLRHAGIVRILDFGMTSESQPYLVMELVEGISLADYLARLQGRMGLADCILMMIEICVTLEHAHRAGVFHRDIKPANIVILDTPTPNARVKLVDFGIAKFHDDDQKLTKTGVAFGSPPYMSPEQCAGQQFDARSEVYSLGCVFYEALTGERAFDGASAMEIVSRHCAESRPALSTSTCDTTFDDTLEQIVDKCIALSPNDRYITVSELRAGLESAYSTLHQKDVEKKTFPEVPPGKSKLPLIAAIAGVVLLIAIPMAAFLRFESDAIEKHIRVKLRDDKELKKTKQTVLDKAILAPREAFKLTSVRSGGILSASGLDDITEEDMKALQHRKDFTKLKLAQQGFDGIGLRYLVDAKQLHMLDLCGNRLNRQAWKEIALLKQLAELGVSWNDSLVPADLDNLSTLPHLGKLRLQVPSLSPAAMQRIAAINSLHFLSLNGVEEFEPGTLACFARSKSLEKVHFKACLLTPEVIKEMRTIPCVQEVTFLRCKGINERVINELAAMKITHASFTEMQLDANALMALLPNKTIKRIRLLACEPVSSRDAAALKSKMKHAVEIDFNNSSGKQED